MLIEIPVDDGTAEAFLAGADEAGRPGAVLFMDAFGLRPRIAEMADRIASWGYTVLAPNVFHRQGRIADLSVEDIDKTTPDGRAAALRRVMPRIGTVTPARARDDLGAWLDALRDAGATQPVGVVGYCMGARLAVRAACDRPDAVAACGGFHGGGLATDQPDSPHLALGSARAEFVFGHASHDPSMAPGAVTLLGEALDAAGLVATNDVYPGPHGYTMSDTASHDAGSEERHWEALHALLARTLGVRG